MAKHEVQLTKNDNSIYVGDVDVSKGVYNHAVDGSVFFYCKMPGGILAKSSNDGEFPGVPYPNLQEAMERNRNADFFRLPDNRRITITKNLTVEELKNTDHVLTSPPIINGFKIDKQKSTLGRDKKVFLIAILYLIMTIIILVLA